MKKQKKWVIPAAALAAGLLGFLLCFTRVFYSLDKLFSDPLYQTGGSRSNTIKMIVIDEPTLDAGGTMSNWIRPASAQLIELLTRDPETAPDVIGFDIMFTGENEENTDADLAEAAAKAGNVVSGANIVYTDKAISTSKGLTIDSWNVAMVERPFAALDEVSDVGFTNSYIDRDGYTRFAGLVQEYQGESLYSLPAKIYLNYCEKEGLQPRLPETYSHSLFNFAYSGKSGSYEIFSLKDVLKGLEDGSMDPRIFAKSIVLVGVYAPGFGEEYNAAIQHGRQMYGVEIQANILQALMQGKTGLPVNNLIYSVAVGLLCALFVLLACHVKLAFSTIALVILAVGDVLLGKMLFGRGLQMSILELPLFAFLIYIACLARNYVAELLRRRQILTAFQKYVAPQVVKEISKSGDYEIRLGGEKRNIACLFVDIRGFTPMSEGLQPEQVVEILNEYLHLTTNAIFKNGGTLDKFIGDATMAVFNAPFDLDDYVYRAVCTARDIAAGSDELEKKLMERFGKSVSFGIGVNCGDAVVGNIGCDFRMDYTAIGDTVNTAARLESNAKRRQILISQAVYDVLKDRIKVTEVGTIPLKGKSVPIMVYQLDEILE